MNRFSPSAATPTATGRRCLAAALLLIPAFLLPAGCQDSGNGNSSIATTERAASDSKATDGEDTSFQPVRRDADHIPNLVQLHPRVYSGGLPEGQAAFAELKALGITTIISVDGARPDVESASKYGLTYVHLPHGYNGIPQETSQQLARCIQLADGPVYLHCHHGKHRSPAAATVACVGVGYLKPDQALAVLKLAGTNPHYQGLYQSAEKAQQWELEILDQLPRSFPSVAQLPPLAEAMVEMQHSLDHLKLLRDNDWKTVETHPDLQPAHQALLLMEHYHELIRTQAQDFPDEQFLQWMSEGEKRSSQLYQDLAAQGRETVDSAAGTASNDWASQLDLIQANCQACHVVYRDAPLPDNAARKSGWSAIQDPSNR